MLRLFSALTGLSLLLSAAPALANSPDPEQGKPLAALRRQVNRADYSRRGLRMRYEDGDASVIVTNAKQ